LLKSTENQNTRSLAFRFFARQQEIEQAGPQVRLAAFSLLQQTLVNAAAR